ncbi:IFIT5 protein, partial [Amia calva]|nr:IFIT5 protein [Amia calva]
MTPLTLPHITSSIIVICSVQNMENLEIKLKELECHFTWDLRGEDADLDFLEEKLKQTMYASQVKSKETVRALNYLAYVKHLQGFNDEAVKYLENSEEEAKDNEAAFEKLVIVTYGNFAWVYYHMGEISKVQMYLEELDKIRKDFPTASPSVLHREVHGEKGWSLLKFSPKHFEKAKECFGEALKREPNDEEWTKGYAFTLYYLEEAQRIPFQKSAAVTQLQKARIYNPKDAMIMVFLGSKYLHDNRTEDAKEYFDKAVEMSPYDPRIIRKVGKFLKKIGCVENTLEVLNNALQKFPDSASLHYQTALCYKLKVIKMKKEKADYGQLVKLCILHLETAVCLNPSYIYHHLELASMYAESMDMQKAENLFQELFTKPNIKPAQQQALHRYYGDFQYYHKKSESDAVEHYKKGQQIRNESHEREKCFTSLKKIAEINIKKNPHDKRHLEILGNIHILNAIASYEKALEVDPHEEDYNRVLTALRSMLV